MTDRQSLLQMRTKARVRRDGTDVEESALPWVRKFVDYAQLAAIVYRREAVSIEDPIGWERIETEDDRKTSLYYEVWDHAAAPAQVALVFRGTHEAKDWWSNLRWVTRFIPIGWDQYNVVRNDIAAIVERARTRLPQAQMVTVGHSLGGGLAQQAAYAHPDIKLVVAFDSSPVTGFRSVSRAEREKNARGIEVFRAYEKGEVLAYLRGFLRKFLPLSTKDPAIVEVRFNLSKGFFAIQEHSMVSLAKMMKEFQQPV